MNNLSQTFSVSRLEVVAFLPWLYKAEDAFPGPKSLKSNLSTTDSNLCAWLGQYLLCIWHSHVPLYLQQCNPKPSGFIYFYRIQSSEVWSA